MYELITFPNGVRLALERVSSVRSASVGIWVGVGSRLEGRGEEGSAHFIEHMLFKGTGKSSAARLAERMDAIGGQINAFTSRESTCFYARVLDTHLREAVDILKENAGPFSAFRGSAMVPLVCKMSFADDPAEYLDDVAGICAELNQGAVKGNPMIIPAAMIIWVHVKGEDPEDTVAQTKEIFRRMKKAHPFLTSEEDIPFAAMLASAGPETDEETDTRIARTEEIYKILSKEFWDKNAAQSLSHVLALIDAPAEETCGRALEIYDILKKKGRKFGSGRSLSVLGSLVMSEVPAEEVAEELLDAEAYLTARLPAIADDEKEIRLVYAAQMVYSTHLEKAGTAAFAVLGLTMEASVGIGELSLFM